MFLKYGIKMKKKDLRDFFLQIDENSDDTLNWREFKSAITNEDAAQVFINIMRRLRNEKNEQKLKERMKFLGESLKEE